MLARSFCVCLRTAVAAGSCKQGEPGPPHPKHGPFDLRAPGRSRSNALADLFEIF
jgi:hypothetical protein